MTGEITLDAASPEAERANELAREILTARLAAMQAGDQAEDVRQMYLDSLSAAVHQVFDSDSPMQAAGYLASALASVGTAAVLFAAAEAATRDGVELTDNWSDIPEYVDGAMRAVGRLMIREEKGKRWPRI